MSFAVAADAYGQVLGSAGAAVRGSCRCGFAAAKTALPVRVEHATFEEWWEPFMLGVGPAGSYLTALDSAQQIDLRERCRQRLSHAPFTLSARAWAARGLV